MERVTIKIDLSKIDKDRIEERSWEGGASKDYKIDLVPLKEPRVIKEGDTWRLIQKYFVCNTPTKEERAAKTNTAVIGEGTVIENKDIGNSVETPW